MVGWGRSIFKFSMGILQRGKGKQNFRNWMWKQKAGRGREREKAGRGRGLRFCKEIRGLNWPRRTPYYMFKVIFIFHPVVITVLELVSHPEEIWGFSAGGLVDFFNTYKILLFYLSCIRCYWIEHKEAHCLLEKIFRQQQFFLFFIFGDIFLGAHNVWTLPFSVWTPPWLHRLGPWCIYMKCTNT